MPTASKCTALGLLLALFMIPPTQAQTSEGPTVEVEPASLNLGVGETAQLEARVVGAEGAEQEGPLLFFSRDRRAVGVDSTGKVTAFEPGSFSVIAMRPGAEGEEAIYQEVAVEVAFPPITSLSFAEPPTQVYAGTRVPLAATGTDATGEPRTKMDVQYTSSNPDVLAVDATGRIEAKQPGEATITAQAEGVSATAGRPGRRESGDRD